MEYIFITTIQEYESEPQHSYALFGRKIGIFRRKDGSYYGLETNCKHQGADLLTGTVEDGVATCPRHDWCYDLETGRCLSNASPALREYQVLVDGGRLKISRVTID